MQEVVAERFREVCAACRRPLSVCYCRHVTTFSTRTRVVLLQHPRERDVPVNTARIASLCLPEAEVHVGLRLPASVALHDPRRPAALLYPGPGAVDIERSPPAGDVTLVVVDGTWSQARKIVRLDPALATLPRYAFRPSAPSEYRIRREPHDDYVSTLEALIHVLGVLEGERSRFLPMMRPFRAMVEAQVAFAASGDRRRRLRKERVRVAADPRDRLPPALRRAEALVCVHAESNAWPYGVPQRDAYPEEIVQWVATRPATGESFEALVAPRHPLCPHTPRHLEIEGEALLGGLSVAALHDRWSRFLRPGDVVCGWGAHPMALFEAAGGALPADRVDLRLAARVYANAVAGTVDAFREHFDLPPLPPLARGRAGARLAALSSIASFFAAALARC